MRRHTGMVFQSFNLFPHLSVLDNVTLAPRRVLKLERSVAEQRARELLSRIGLADKASEYPDRLSGGQQQRVAIVRSLAMNPRLLLLDEVTSALDPELVAEVLDLVRELAHQGMTMLVATHEMGFAREVANTVLFLEGGVIVESGPPRAIFGASPRASHPAVSPAHRRRGPAVDGTGRARMITLRSSREHDEARSATSIALRVMASGHSGAEGLAMSGNGPANAHLLCSHKALTSLIVSGACLISRADQIIKVFLFGFMVYSEERCGVGLENAIAGQLRAHQLTVQFGCCLSDKLSSRHDATDSG